MVLLKLVNAQISDIGTVDTIVRAQAPNSGAISFQNSANLFLETSPPVGGGAAGRVALRPSGNDAFSAESSTHITLFGSPTWTTGALAPSSNEPEGSIYTRTGASNGDFYVRRAGNWISIASVGVTLSGDVTGPAAGNIVVGMTGVANTIAVHGSNLTWDLAISSPTISQATNTAPAAVGIDTTIHAQNTSGAGSAGGNLILSSGLGTSTSGILFMQSGGTTVASIIPTKLVFNLGRRRHMITTTISYQVLATDDLISVGTTASSITITLPASPVAGDIYEIKDTVGQASIRNIIINGNGINVEGNSTLVMNQDFDSVSVYYNGTTWSAI